MKYPYPALPELTVNHSFMVDLVTADTPCFAMGLVEEGGIEYGFLGFRPNDPIPRADKRQTMKNELPEPQRPNSV